MVKGEFQFEIINTGGEKGETISVMFIFDRNTDMGKYKLGISISLVSLLMS
jgi:hypothetical protein